MALKWRKWNRAIHRDLGYIFFGMTLIYSLSGIALNHIDDWNPNYIVTTRDVRAELPVNRETMDKGQVKEMLRKIDINLRYKKHYYPEPGELKVFIDGGSLVVDLATGAGTVENLKRRPVFNQVNFLHYNPGKWWTLFSDLFSVSLILIAISGLFILRGSHGITGRGAWLTIAGLLIPTLFMILFY